MTRALNISAGVAGLLTSLALLAVTLAFWPTLSGLIALWMDSDRPFSHGLLVGPIALWLMIRACFGEHHGPITSSATALALFGVTTVVWVLAYSVDVLSVQEMLFPLLLILATTTIAGWSVGRRLFFPAAFLYFAIPIWTVLTPVLQRVTVAVVGSVLDTLGIPLFVEGSFITIPEGVFEVAGGCAGLHFFVVAVTLASLHGYLYLDGWRRRLALVGVAVGLALVTNWLRVGSLVAIGHLSDMKHYLITHDHYYYGWALFAVALVPFLMFARRQAALSAAPGRPPSVQTDLDGRPQVSRSWLRDLPIYGFFIAVLAIPVALTNRVDGDDAPKFSIDLPTGVDGWQRAEVTDWSPSYAGADADTLAGYVRDLDQVDVYVAVYRSQAQGRELVGNDNRIHGEGWRQQSASSTPVQGLEGLSQVQERVIASREGRPRVVWIWYSFAGRLVTRDWIVKFWQAFGNVQGRDPGAVIAISTQCADDCSEARTRLQEFVLGMGHQLNLMAARYQVDSGA